MRTLLQTLCLLVALAAFAPALQAQTADYPESWAFRAIAVNYKIPEPLLPASYAETPDFTAGMEAEYYRHLSKRFNLSFPFRIFKAQLLNEEGSRYRQSINFGLNALMNINLYNGRVFRPHFFTGVGTVLERSQEFNIDVPFGLGLNLLLGKATYLSATGAYHFSGDYYRDHVQAGLGLRLMFGNGEKEMAPTAPSDRDGDGIADASDLCPDQAGTAALNGCPDRDGDGIADASDLCPDQAGTKALSGCPDSDNDGVADASDKCPNEAGPASNMGCPVTDRDGDGIADASDKCPDLAGVASAGGCPDRDGDGLADANDDCPNQAGTAANGGCPDTDNDGIVDRLDSCPNEAGPAGNKGCPEISQTDRAVLTEAVQAVEFETGSAVIRKDSYEILDKVADILKRYPGYKVRIGGHTDSIGSAESNMSLSEKRAKACYDYLLNKGISAGRMSHQGYGESQPIGDNRYAPGREQNRRVEFDVYIE
ncbi:MAG: OmpA family protein [Saprospiraceae bacterium]